MDGLLSVGKAELKRDLRNPRCLTVARKTAMDGTTTKAPNSYIV